MRGFALGVVVAAMVGMCAAGPFAPLASASGVTKRDLRSLQCPRGLTLCGVQSPWSRDAHECIDTTRDLESCGGCTIALLGEQGVGQDCTAIPGIEDVACTSGVCEVFSCRRGYTISGDGTSCEKVGHVPGLHHADAMHID